MTNERTNAGKLTDWRRGSQSQRVLPVGLFVDGAKCLIVGGGNGALPRLEALGQAGAQVVIVAPRLSPAVGGLAAAEGATILSRPFQDGDVTGMRVVFATTDDRAVNERIAARCREHGILCCSVDKGRVSGDFLAPATLRQDGLTVSISSEGGACRRSRLIRDGLVRHIEMLGAADLFVIGTSHRFLSLEDRSRYHLDEASMERVGSMLMQVWGVHEYILLNTCNRVELLAVVTRDSATDLLLERVMGFEGLTTDQHYRLAGMEAFAHVARTCAGLLSQTPGENHIMAQTKSALRVALARGWAGGMMQEWVASASHIAKHIRVACEHLLRGSEVEDVCIGELVARVPNLTGSSILVLGSGTVGKGCIERLVRLGCHCTWLYHNRRPTVRDVWKEQVEVAKLEQVAKHVPEAHVIICATASTGHVLDRRQGALLSRAHDVLLMDLCVPRNIDPEVDALAPTITVLDLDGLERSRDGSPSGLDQTLDTSAALLAEHRSLYDKLAQSFRGQVGETAGSARPAEDTRKHGGKNDAER
jgi:glutamyl-tRNA reductase